MGVVEILEDIFTRTSTSKSRKQKARPFVKKNGADATDTDLLKTLKRAENGAPILYLFYSGNDFETAVISADDHFITCDSNATNAVLTFIGVYYVFHLGYISEHVHFLTFLQVTLLQKESSGSHPLGWHNLLSRLNTIMES